MTADENKSAPGDEPTPEESSEAVEITESGEIAEDSGEVAEDAGDEGRRSRAPRR